MLSASRFQKIIRFYLVVVMLLIASKTVIAKEQSYWVTGSFMEEATALDQQAKLSRQTGLSVLIMPTTINQVQYHRVVVKVSPDRATRRQQEARLHEFGIGNAWLLTVHEPDTPVQQIQTKPKQVVDRPSKAAPQQATPARTTSNTESPSLLNQKPSVVNRDTRPQHPSPRVAPLKQDEVVDMARYPTKKSLLLFCSQKATAAQRAKYCTDAEYAKKSR